MKTGKLTLRACVLTLLAFGMVPAIYAGPGAWGGRGKPGIGKHRGPEARIFRSLHFIERHQEELGITDEQVERLQDVCRETRKQLIRTDAEIQVLSLDLKDRLEADKIEPEKINPLIDQRTEHENRKQKLLVRSLAEFKNVLSAEQQKALKTLVRKKMEERRERRCNNRDFGDRPMGRFQRNQPRD